MKIFKSPGPAAGIWKFQSGLAALFVVIVVTSAIAAGTALKDWVPLKLKLPAPTFVGTPPDAPAGVNLDPASTKPRPPLMVPKDVRNITPGSKITCSDSNATAAALSKITDGNKEASEASIVLLRKGRQFVQFDLGGEQEIFAIVVWHAHDTPKVYRDVVVQTSEDADFSRDVVTLFNNDLENALGLGAGKDYQYFETNLGKVIDAKGTRARFVRLYSKGSTDSALNEYTEVEIYARSAK
jgi:hypothetical protein